MNALASPLPLARAAPALDKALTDYGDLACGVIKFGTVWVVFWKGQIDPIEHPSRLEAVDWLRVLAKDAEAATRRDKVPQ